MGISGPLVVSVVTKGLFIGYEYGLQQMVINGWNQRKQGFIIIIEAPLLYYKLLVEVVQTLNRTS